jgi:hypothetical protein
VSRAGRLATIALMLLTACASAASSPTDPWTAISGPEREMPPDIEDAEGRPGPNGGTVFRPSSVPIQHGVPYRFSLGHCGLLSPVDVDGSFWDAVDGVKDGRPLDLESDAEMVNATEGVFAVIGDEARFRTTSGAVVRFERHPGDKEFAACA